MGKNAPDMGNSLSDLSIRKIKDMEMDRQGGNLQYMVKGHLPGGVCTLIIVVLLLNALDLHCNILTLRYQEVVSP